MKIGEYSFKAPVFLAPMAGVTDTAYRIIAHDMGCPLCFAEMVSSQGIHFRNERTLAMLQSEPEERPLAMQIFEHKKARRRRRLPSSNRSARPTSSTSTWAVLHRRLLRTGRARL